MAARVVHFDISADDAARAAKFYQDVFGWKIEKYGGDVPMEYWMVVTGPDSEPGINGGMHKRQGPASAGDEPVAFECTIGVDNVDAYAKKIEPAGGKILMAKMGLKGVGWFVHALDTEGNHFSLMQPDPSAA